MKNSKEFKIGVFAVIVLVFSFFLINYLRGEDLFDREIELISRYDNLEGLVASAPVYIKGFKAGKVSQVVYDSDTEDFEVTCSVSKEFRIPADSKMTIYSVDIMGGKGIRIDLGTSSESAGDGATLQPFFEAGLMDGLSEGVGPLLSKVGNTLDSLAITVSNVNKMLSDQNQAAIAASLSHLEATTRSLSRISASVQGKSSEVENFISNLSSLSEKLGTVVDKADSTMAGVSSIVESVSASDIEGVVTSFKTFLESLNDPDGTIGKLLVDGSVYDSVDSLLSDVDELVKKIQENPKKYLRISVF